MLQAINDEADLPDEGEAIVKVDCALSDIAGHIRQQMCKCLEGLLQHTSVVCLSKASCNLCIRNSSPLHYKS